MTPPTDKDWRDFAAWCTHRGLRALPAHPWTVAAYVRWCEPRLRLPAIVRGLKAITRMHLLKCHRTPERDPMVVRTLRRIETQALNRETRAALFRAEDFAALAERRANGARSKQQGREKPKKPARRTPRLVRRVTT